MPAIAALLVAACGDDNDAEESATSPPPPPPGPQVTLSGTVTYDFVPVGPDGLDYSQTEARPARLVTVQYLRDGVVRATTRTDRNGDYSLEVEAEQQGFLRVLAEISEDGSGPSWLYRVVDNTSGDVIYALDGAVASSGSTDSFRDLHAASGWSAAGRYAGERAAAPFAILDTVLVGTDLVVSAEPLLDIPPLDIHWSPGNVPALGVDGVPDPDTGEIGTSQFAADPALGMVGIYLLGAENSDTEEYDRHVILHEFGHFLEIALARSDTIGGSHWITDKLDFRVAFSEGWGSAFAGLALDDPQYRDTGGSQQAGAFGFNIESSLSPSPGWYEERTVYQIIYDLVDAANETDMSDSMTYSFADVWSVMRGAVVTTPAMATIFPFLNAIKSNHAADSMQIDALASAQGIGSITTDFGENETNDAGSADVLPIYTEIAVNGPVVNVCSTDEFTSLTTGAENKLGARRYARFTPLTSGQVTITAIATDIPRGEYADPDFIVYRQGSSVARSEEPPSDACTNTGSSAWQPATCEESISVSLTRAEHVLDLYEWTNSNPDDSTESPPIGRTCFDVMVTQ